MFFHLVTDECVMAKYTYYKHQRHTSTQKDTHTHTHALVAGLIRSSAHIRKLCNTLARCSGDPAVLITLLLLLPHGDTPDICQHQELNRDYLRGRKTDRVWMRLFVELVINLD